MNGSFAAQRNLVARKLKKMFSFICASLIMTLSIAIIVAPNASAQSISEPEYYQGKYWQTQYKAPNPVLSKKCGLSIGMALDLSTSVGAAGIESLKDSLRSWLETLKGQPINIQFFTFATESPAARQLPHSRKINLENAEAYNAAIRYVESLDLAKNKGGLGGTNWEGPLKDANAAGPFDLFYFVTDGEPTTNDAKEPSVDGDLETGYTPHNMDITRAVDQANILKGNGTRMEGILVGNMPDQPVLQDDVVRSTKRPTSSWGRPLTIPSNTFLQVTRNTDTDRGLRRNSQLSYRESILGSRVLTYFHKSDEASVGANNGVTEPVPAAVADMLQADILFGCAKP